MVTVTSPRSRIQSLSDKMRRRHQQTESERREEEEEEKEEQEEEERKTVIPPYTLEPHSVVCKTETM